MRGNLTLDDGRDAGSSSRPRDRDHRRPARSPRAATAPAASTLTATVRVGEATRERTLRAHRPREAAAPSRTPATRSRTSRARAPPTASRSTSPPAAATTRLRWDELNGGQPALTSTLGDKGVRDPFIIRSPEGDKFFLIATDLKIYGNGNWDAAQRTGSQVHRGLGVDRPRALERRSATCEVSPDTAGNTWAPEAYYDDALGAYVVYWASKLYAANDPGHTGNTYNRMMYATTRDFRTFSAPKVWIDPGYCGDRLDRHQARRHLLPLHQGRAQQHVARRRAAKFILEEKATEPARPRLGLRRGLHRQGQRGRPGRLAGRGPDDLQVQHRGQVVPADRRVRRPRLRAVRDHRPRLRASGSCRPASSCRRARATAPCCRSPRPSCAALRNEPDPVQATPEGLVASYERLGARDTTGHGYNGDADRRRHAPPTARCSFGGTNGHVKLPDNLHGRASTRSRSRPRSGSTRRRPRRTSSGASATPPSGAGNGYLFTTGDAYRAAIARGNWTAEQSATAGKNLSRGGWHQLTYTLAGGKAVLYLDGVEVGAQRQRHDQARRHRRRAHDRATTSAARCTRADQLPQGQRARASRSTTAR